MFDFAITGSRRSPKRRTNSRMKILSSASAWVRWIGTGVHLSAGRTLGLALVGSLEFALATWGFEALTFSAGSGFGFGMNLKIYSIKS